MFDPILPLRIHWSHALDTREFEQENEVGRRRRIVDNFCLPAHCLAHSEFQGHG